MYELPLQLTANTHRYTKVYLTIFVCFLDDSYAFDRVNHAKLFHKMSLKGESNYLIRVLVFCHHNQTPIVIQCGDFMLLMVLDKGVYCLPFFYKV